jgi:putative RecB family exonuclease
MRPLSYSQISRYLNCPLSYKLLYIDRLKPKEKFYLSFGDIIHRCAEYFFKVAVPPPPALEKLLQFYEANWISEGYESPEQEQQYKEYGKQLLKDFWNLHSPDFNLPLAVEYKFLVNIDGIPLTGRIDRIDKRDGGISIVDYKTSKDLFTSQQLEQDQQLTFYQLAIEKIWRLPVKSLTLYHLRSNTACTCDGRGSRELNQARETMLRVADGITREIFPATENRFCPYCDFPEHCPYRKHQLAPEKPNESLSGNILKGADAREIVERYAALQNQKKEIESQLDELKQMVCDFCELEGYKRLYGPDHAITYKKVERTGFTEETVRELLEPTGLWPRVLNFDPALVKQLLEADYLNPELKKKLEALKQVTSSYTTLTINPLKEEEE